MRLVRGTSSVRNLLLAFRGKERPQSAQITEATEKIFGEALTVKEAVSQIIAGVREKGDAAVKDYLRRIDGVEIKSLGVSTEDIVLGANGIEVDLRGSLVLAADRIRKFHEYAMPEAWQDDKMGFGQRFVPIEAVGVYVPGGSASYPSTVLHTVIPAKVAGVEKIVLVTPPTESGVAPAILAAARIAGVDKIFQVGGAQAIAALAYGTHSIPRVDKICGPGNVFVTEAKRQVFGDVGIDGLHGPTETMIIGDGYANPDLIASDLLAQAEHDALAMPVLLTDSESLAVQVAEAVGVQLKNLDRLAIAGVSIENNGLIGVLDKAEEAIDLANEFAPEHICLFVKEPRQSANLVRHAGGVFVGENSCEVLGDYVAGPSHVMPTGGTARFASSLGVHDFLKVMPVIDLDGKSEALVDAAAAIAKSEGLTAHVRSAKARKKNGDAGL